MSRRSLALVAALAFIPSIASAGASKAWTAAKKVHPDTPIIAGLDVASAQASESFKKFFPMLVAKKPEVKEVLDKLQSTCQFDPFTAINSIVAVIDDAADNKGAFYIALNKGWNTAKIGDCAQKLAKGEGKEIKAGAVKKGIQEMTMVGKDEKIYLGWIGKDVLVIATEPTDKAFVQSMLSSKPKGEADKLASKLDTSSTVWMAIIKDQSIQPGIDMKSMYGTVKIANANVASDVRIVTADDKQATNLVTTLNQQLPQVQKGMPPAIQNMMKTLKVVAAGKEVQATASAAEKDLLSLMPLLGL
jgi:hypothetical protein